MSNIHFVSISGRNHNTFEDFHFPFVEGKHLVLGVNGAGKSSIFESIPWNIWRKSIRDKDPSRNGKGNNFTRLEFIKDEVTYVIERYWKDAKEGNNIKFYANGENISPRKMSSIDDEIQKIVSYSSDLFISTIVVLQGLPINFSSLTGTVRKSIVEEMLGFSVWDDIRLNFSAYIRDLNMKKAAVDNSLAQNKADMISLNAQIDTIKKISSQNKDALLEEMKQAKNKYRDIMTSITKLSEEITSLYQNKTINEYRSELNGLNTSLKILSNRKETLKALIETSVCPECNQQYPIDKINSAKKELESINPKTDAINKSIVELNRIVYDYNTKLESKRDLEAHKSNSESSIQAISNKINNTNVEYNMEELESNLANLVEVVNGLMTESSEFSTSSDNLKYIDNLLLPSSKFRTKVLEKYMDYINSIISSVTPLLFQNLDIKLVLDKNGLELEVNRKGIPIGYKSLSGGEKRRLDIVIILSFQRFLMESSGISSNLLVFDEIFDNLDREGIESVLNCVDSLFPESMCQYIITHNNSLRSMFSSIVQVTKENDSSKIEYLSEGG